MIVNQIVKVQIVQDVAIYVNGVLELHAKAIHGVNEVNEQVREFYEDNLHKEFGDLQCMFISSYSKFWETEYGRKDQLPSQLEDLQKVMDANKDVIELLPKSDYQKVIF